LAANQSSTFGVVFAPDHGRSAVSGSLAFTVGGSTALNLCRSREPELTPATLTANPASFTFTNVVSQSQSQTETVKNTGGENATISQGYGCRHRLHASPEFLRR
jgi:hypothetical protein